MEGKTISGYTFKRLLGVGGMAEVWYAENKIGKKAAVKMLLPKLCADENVKSRFYTEAKVMVELNHPNIRQVYDYGEIDGRPAIVMEYLDGDDLKARMKRGQRFTDEELKKWWNQLVSALNYTHQKGIVHRDIKPGNIFVDCEGNVRLLDFGIAKVRESISKTMTGQKLGTLMYMSPEQVKDSKHIDYRTDVYSLAVSFVHLLTGKRPYDSDTTSDFEISEQIVYKPLSMDKVPEAWRVFLMPYLEKDPVKRPELHVFNTKVETDGGNSKRYEEEKTEMDKPATIENNIWLEKKPVLPNEDAPKKKGRGWVVAVCLAAVVIAAVLLLRPKKKVVSLDTQAYQACQTVKDYRNYLSNFGRNAEHYSEAKNYVDDYVADSITKVEQLLAQQQAQEEAEAEAKAKAEAEKQENTSYQKCTTIATCDNYLKKYPNGRYVEQVRYRKEELEQIEKEAKTKKEQEMEEETLYKKCTTIADCNNYLKKYPQGRYAKEVKAKMDKMQIEANDSMNLGSLNPICVYYFDKDGCQILGKEENVRRRNKNARDVLNSLDIGNIKGFYIEAWCVPEYGDEEDRSIAETRANAVVREIKSQLKKLANNYDYKVSIKGPDYIHAEHLIINSNIEDKDQILRLMNDGMSFKTICNIYGEVERDILPLLYRAEVYVYY